MKTVWNKPRKIISIAILILAGISTTNQLTAYSIGFETSKSIFRKFVNNTDVFLKYDSLIILDAPLRIGDAAIVPTAEEFLLSFYVLEDQQGNWFLKKSDSDVPKHIDFLSYISMPSGILTYEVEWYIHKDTLFGNVTDNCYFEMNAKDRDGVAILKETMNYTLTGDSRNGSHYLWKSVKLYPFSSISSSTGFFSLRSGKIEQLFKNDNSDL
jgi:hypothetical protein